MTEAGLRNDISVGVQYLESWLRGTGAVAAKLRGVLGNGQVISDRQELRTYECDGLAQYRVIPALVVFPRDAAECATVVRACVEAGVPFVARGSGTGLSGGALPHAEGVLVVTSRMRRIVEVAPEDERGAGAWGIMAAGVVPAAVEMMDALAIEAAEAAVHCGYPNGAGAVLIVELDGPGAEVDAQFVHVERYCREHGAFEIRIATDATERGLFWKGRKSAFAAVGRISSD